jgi:phage terminase small subunit
LRKGKPTLAGALANVRHERFCQEYVNGKSQGEAYLAAGYKTTFRRSADTCATRLMYNVEIRKRISELQRYVADSENITIASLMREAAQIQKEAMQAGNQSAAVAALTAKAKLAGLWVEKSETENVSLHYALSDQLPTEQQWEAERVIGSH